MSSDFQTWWDEFLHELTNPQPVDRPRVDFRNDKGEFVQGRTHGEHKKECDVNRIMRAYTQKGELTHVNREQPLYGDFTFGTELAECMERVQIAHENFMELPAEVRQLAENDPVTFLAMMNSDDGVQELVNVGLQVDGFTKNTGKTQEAPTGEAPAAPPAEAPSAPSGESSGPPGGGTGA